MKGKDRQRSEMSTGEESAVWALALLAIIFVPAALLEALTLHAFRPRSFVSAFAIVAVFSLLVIAGTWIASRDVGMAIRAAAAATFAIFWWTYLSAPAGVVAERIPFLSADIAIVVIVTTISYAMLRYGRLRIVSVMVVMLVLAVAGTLIVTIRDLSIVAQPSRSIVRSVSPPGQTPNVFVLLLDGYPRSDVLNAVFGTSDAAFVSVMGSMGIATNPDSWSNYDRTYASVASMLSLETMLTDDVFTDPILSRLRGVSGGDGEFLRAFRDAGYNVTFSPSSWNGSRCDSIVDDCIAIGSTRSSLYWLLRGSVFAPMVPLVLRSPWTDVALRQIDSIAEIHIGAMQPERPSIVFMHAALPHPPIVLNATCQETKRSWRFAFGVPERGLGDSDSSEIGAQVQCVGALVAAEVAQILDHDPSAAVLVLSDHGMKSVQPSTIVSADFTDDQIWDRLKNLFAFGGPPRCGDVLDEVSTVGALREMVRCLLGADVIETPLDGFLLPSEYGAWVGEPPVRVVFDGLPAGLTDDENG